MGPLLAGAAAVAGGVAPWIAYEILNAMMDDPEEILRDKEQQEGRNRRAAFLGEMEKRERRERRGGLPSLMEMARQAVNSRVTAAVMPPDEMDFSEAVPPELAQRARAGMGVDPRMFPALSMMYGPDFADQIGA